MPDFLPVEIRRQADRSLAIRWNNGAEHSYSVSLLRDKCPCAVCREKTQASSKQAPTAAGLPVISMQEARPLEVARMEPVGNYAYNIAFSDGHDSGIYPFEFLYQLGASGEQ